MNGIFNSIFWFISPLPAAFLYNYTLAYGLSLGAEAEKDVFSGHQSHLVYVFHVLLSMSWPALPPVSQSHRTV